MTTKKTAGRGRPRSFDADQAIDVAQRLFVEHGYDGVGVADIGRALGITPPSFYNAFGSKAALFDRVLDRYSATSFMPEILDQPGSSTDAIERALLEAAHRYALCDGVSGCLVLDGARNSQDSEAVALTARRKAQSRAMFAARIAQDLPDKADRLAAIALVALNGLSSSARDGASEADLSAFARAFSKAYRLEAEG